MNIRKFKITASIIGPYLPLNSLKIDKYTILKTDSKIPNMLPPKISASAVDETMLVISQDIAFDTKYIVVWEVEAASSKVAHENGNIELERLLYCLTLPASSYKYYASIVRVEHINKIDTPPDPESASSPPVHVLGYETKDLSQDNKHYYEELLSMQEPEVNELLNKFYSGVKSEILSTGDSDLIYYKLLEEISHKVLKSLKKEGSSNPPDYNSVLKKVEELFTEELNNQEKAQKIKDYANQLRALDYEQVGERILLAAKEFKLIPEVIETLKNISKYRAKVLAHPGKNDSTVKLKDPRDVREMARLFLLHYLHKFYNISPPEFEPVKENDSWYRFNYSRSDVSK